MNFTGKYEKICEDTLYRFQQNGFLRGDYVKVRKNALQNECVKSMSEQMKALIDAAIKENTYLRISYIKSGRSEVAGGPVDAPNIPGSLWADVYFEHAPGMWSNVMTLPLEVLELVEVTGANGYAQYNPNLVRPNTPEPKPSEELNKQTLGKDDMRQLPTTNKKLEYAKEPKDGRSQTRINEDVVIFEQYYDHIRNQQKA